MELYYTDEPNENAKANAVVKLSLDELEGIAESTEAMKDAKEGDLLPESLAYLVNALGLITSVDGNERRLLDDEQRERMQADLEKAQRLYRASQLAYFREQYAPEINEHEADYWKFPYTGVSYALIAYEQARFGNITDKKATELVEPQTWGAFKDAHANIEPHFWRVWSAIEDGTFIDDNGERVVKVEDGEIDITPIVDALFVDGFDEAGVFGDWEPPLNEGEPSTYWHLKPHTWKHQAGDGEIVEVEGYCLCYEEWEQDEDTGEVEHVDIETPFELDYFGFWYLTLYALVTLLDCEKSVRALAYPTKRQMKRKYLTTKTRVMQNDTVTNALFGRDENAIQPAQYFGGKENAIEIATGKKLSASLYLVNDMSVEDAVEAYRLSPVDRFWLEGVCSMAHDGTDVIRGSDLLKFSGYKNPYQETSRGVMEQAIRSITKMRKLEVMIDTTKELSHYKGLSQAIDFKPIIDCNYRLMRFDDGTSDFEIMLNVPKGGAPIDALPLAVYASDKKQLLAAPREEMEFKTVKRLSLDHRVMWAYVLRRIETKGLSETLRFDTILKNTVDGEITRNKRFKMLRVLHSMLEERQADGKLTFEWIRNERTGRDEKVIITPTEKAKSAI